MIEQRLKDIIFKILGGYAVFLCIFGTLSNLIVFYICSRKRLWRINTFKFFGIMTLSDIIGLYEWNLKHFITAFFGVDFNFTSLAWCRLSIFLQYAFLQYSAWILVSIALDRYLCIILKNWQKCIFNKKKPLWFMLALLILIWAINFNVLFTNGYSIVLNGSEIIICYAQYDNDYTLFNIMGQIHLYLYSIVPFLFLKIFNGLLIYMAVFSNWNKIGNRAEVGKKNKINMTRTVLTINFIFIIMTLPSAIVSGYFFIPLNNTDYGSIIITLCDNITFSFHSYNLIILYFSNKQFEREFKSVLFNLFRIKNLANFGASSEATVN